MNIAIQNVVREIDFGSSLTADSDTAAKYFEDADAALRSLGPPSSRSGDAKRDAQDIKVLQGTVFAPACRGDLRHRNR